MANLTHRGDSQRRPLPDLLFEQASKLSEEGKLAAAFGLFLKSAEAGDLGAQLNIGNLYIDGIGVRRNRTLALEWYRRAYRQGYGPAASNLGAVYRNEGKLQRALLWFERAASLKDGDANLEIAKILLRKRDVLNATRYLKKTLAAGTRYVTEASKEEARSLLRQLGK